MKNVLKAFLSATIIVLAVSCAGKVKFHPDFDENGLLCQEYIDSFYSVRPTKQIKFYVETSGSMNGLYRPGKSTRFKTAMNAILIKNSRQIKGITAFVGQDNGSGMPLTKEYSKTEFRSKMNNGGLNSTNSTIVPDMLRYITEEVHSDECDVAVFVSDMKYSPAGNPATAIPIYKDEIEAMFSDCEDLSVSVIGLESEYVSAGGTTVCDSFPYYLIVIGKKGNAEYIRNLLLASLDDDSGFQGCIDYNYSFGCPYYTVLPTVGTVGVKFNIMQTSQQKTTFHSYTVTSPSHYEFIVAVNNLHLPYEIIKDDSLDYITDSYTKGLDVSYCFVDKPRVGSALDQSLLDNVKPDTYIKVECNNMQFDTDVISLSVGDMDIDDRWIEKYYGATREGELDKTYTMDSFIKGLTAAYGSENEYQSKPILVYVSTKE